MQTRNPATTPAFLLPIENHISLVAQSLPVETQRAPVELLGVGIINLHQHDVILNPFPADVL